MGHSQLKASKHKDFRINVEMYQGPVEVYFLIHPQHCRAEDCFRIMKPRTGGRLVWSSWHLETSRSRERKHSIYSKTRATSKYCSYNIIILRPEAYPGNTAYHGIPFLWYRSWSSLLVAMTSEGEISAAVSHHTPSTVKCFKVRFA